MTLAVRKNIFDAAQKLEDVIQRFETATGLKFDVEIDFAALLASHATMSDSQKEQIGDLIYGEYLKDLSYGMVEFCKKPLQKEAVVELATARKITFSIISDKKIWDQTTEGNKHRYLRTRLVDGAMCELSSLISSHAIFLPFGVDAALARCSKKVGAAMSATFGRT
jgi:hypothetical protein